MNTIGIGHTFISVLALLVAAIILFRNGTINPYSKWGKLYSGLTAIACVSAFALLKHGFNPGHVLGILILLLLGISYWLGQKKATISAYLVTICMSATVFLSLIPGINETLTRLPVHHPIANGPTSPIVLNALKVLLLLFAIGLTTQIWWLRKTLKNNG